MKMTTHLRCITTSFIISATLILSTLGCSQNGNNLPSSVRNVDGMVFQTPEAALAELKTAFASEDPERIIAIYGEMSRDAMVTGDPIADAAFMRKISAKLDQRAELIATISPEHPNEQWYKVRFSIEGWNMRIPLVNRGNGWIFATEYGKDAIAEMRREANEVLASDTLFLLVAAQREYFRSDYDRDGIFEYAQKIISDSGEYNGLYWEADAGAPTSPLDGTILKALAAGYSFSETGIPYYGYRYKILTSRANGSKSAAQSFIKNDQMIGGFAIIAYPATWGVSGSKTMVVDSTGRMYKKDLGFNTESIASEMTTMRIDPTWPRVEHPELGMRL